MMPQPQQTSITNTPCPLCLAAEAAPFYAKNGYVIVECAACHMRFVSPMPPPEELTAHYQKAEYFSGENDQGYLNYADMKKALQPHFQHRLQIIEAQLPQRGKILEVGCAAGYFLEEARQRGWHISGMELSQDMAHNAEQLLHIPIYTTLAAVLDRDFDAITLWEVIEHLPDPIGTLRQLRDRLRPGGMLMLSTPNTGHWQAIRAKERWIGYRPPSHLQYFTRETLADSLRRAGFGSVEVNGTAPLPPLPAWLRTASKPLEQALATGQARPWKLALFTWRGIRILGWGWQKIAHRSDDIFATLEALAVRAQ
jgi:2-polyprenyl-3-methyl-5-hydroxy-6-metoxy-1,4-benzoquinol methylase